MTSLAQGVRHLAHEIEFLGAKRAYAKAEVTWTQKKFTAGGCTLPRSLLSSAGFLTSPVAKVTWRDAAMHAAITLAVCTGCRQEPPHPRCLPSDGSLQLSSPRPAGQDHQVEEPLSQGMRDRQRAQAHHPELYAMRVRRQIARGGGGAHEALGKRRSSLMTCASLFVSPRGLLMSRAFVSVAAAGEPHCSPSACSRCPRRRPP